MRNLKYGIQTGKNQPIPKLVRFIPKLSRSASVHWIWLAGKRYKKVLSISQMKTSAVNRVIR